jgi:hypothetical protein
LDIQKRRPQVTTDCPGISEASTDSSPQPRPAANSLNGSSGSYSAPNNVTGVAVAAQRVSGGTGSEWSGNPLDVGMSGGGTVSAGYPVQLQVLVDESAAYA